MEKILFCNAEESEKQTVISPKKSDRKINGKAKREIPSADPGL